MRPLFLFLLSMCSIHAIGQTATDIVRKADEKLKGKTSAANITITIVRPEYSREMSVKSWTKGDDLALILVTAPEKDKGIVYLKRDKEIWNWVPSIERTIKMPPSMLSQSWMGTDFTNDHLVKEASIADDYTASFTADSTIENRLCYGIILIPKPESAVVWGKVIMYVDKKDLMILHARYYDEEAVLINTMQCSEVKTLGGKLLPAKMEMTPADKKGYKTVLLYNALEFDKPIEDNFFTTQNMPRVK